jgi:toxin HigB-1
VEVGFATERLKKICESRAERTRRFGDVAASKLKTRLDDLAAAANLEDMRHLPGHWEELTGDRKGQFSCRLAGGLRLIVQPTKQPPPVKPDGGLDWRAIDGATVINVQDYHD